MSEVKYKPGSVDGFRRKITAQVITARQLKAVEAALVHLMNQHGFFASPLVSREIQSIPEGTAAVDQAATVLVCEPWFETLTTGERLFVLAHEAGHVMMAHHVRMGDRDPHRCNIAMDCALNGWLIADKIGTPPKDCVTIDTVGKHYGWPSSKVEALRNASWEEIYHAISDADAKQPKPQPGKPGDGKPGEGKPDGKPDGKGSPSCSAPGQGWGNVTPDTDATPEEIAKATTEAAEAMQQALQQAILAGNAPDSLRKRVADAVAPKVDWRSVLRNWLAKGSTVREYTYKRLPRRLSTWRLPCPVKTGMGRVIVLIDKSGSISEAATSAYIAELNAIIGEVVPEETVVAAFDHGVHEPEVFGQGEAVTYQYQAGGGTSFVNALDWAAGEYRPGDKVVVFTDLEAAYPEDSGMDVLWVAVGARDFIPRPPFGEVVEVKVSEM